MAGKAGGRKPGGKNRGFFYRSGRGWVTSHNGSYPLLRGPSGEPLKDRKTPERVLREAHARWLVDRDKADREAQRAKEAEAKAAALVTVLQACQSYLANAKATGSAKTHNDRADTLFDFCFGLPPEFRSKDDKKAEPLTAARKKAMAAKRIHEGYGKLPVVDLLPLHVDQWLNAHPTWNGGRRSRVQAVKRALNYATEAGLISANPIRGYRTPKSTSRVTYITPEQEEALRADANSKLSTAIQVCIRTGARPGCEFAALTARHVRIQGDRMEWTFSKDESKTGKVRVLRIRDPEIIEIVKERLASVKSGPLFLNNRGKPWTRSSLSLRFRNVKARLEKKGVEFDPDCCMYSCRHTYAKRTLQGYWTGKMTNIETLAALMGNSPQVCRDHYLQWSEVDNERLWDAS